MNKHDLEKKVFLSARNYGISSVLFRHVVGQRLHVNVTDMECLGLLFHKGLASPTELSRYTGLSPSATTAMLDRLEKAKLIRRTPNPKDRRSTLIEIEANSAETVGPLFAGIRAGQSAMVAHYSEAQLQLLIDFFEKSAALWDKEREKLTN